MAGHRSDDQQARPAIDAFTREMLELAERPSKHDLLAHRDLLAADAGRVDAELGLAARRGGVGEDFEARGDQRAHRAVAPRVRRVVQPSGAKTGKLARTCKKRALHFIGVVEHRTSSSPRGTVMWPPV